MKKNITNLKQKEKTYERKVFEKDVVIEQLKDSIEEYKTELERIKKDLKLNSIINININNTGNNTVISNNNNNKIDQGKSSLCWCYNNKLSERSK